MSKKKERPDRPIGEEFYLKAMAGKLHKKKIRPFRVVEAKSCQECFFRMSSWIGNPDMCMLSRWHITGPCGLHQDYPRQDGKTVNFRLLNIEGRVIESTKGA